MKKTLLAGMMLLLGGALTAAPGMTFDAREVTVQSARPMKFIGLHETVLDSAVLKESIALSMADVLAANSSVFVKQAGRATLSTVAFRGTAASHTQVTWNGVRINSPMLGMTDFSMIPACFVDNASLLHGPSSVTETDGGLGGAVQLSTKAEPGDGVRLQYVQGAGSFGTADEYLRLDNGRGKWQWSTRAVYSSSPNRYPYTNRDKKENVYDDAHRITGSYHPRVRNESGAYRDLHLLQEVYRTARDNGQWSGQVWYTSSNREIPLLTTDYGAGRDFENRQREETLRSRLGYARHTSRTTVEAAAGWLHTWLAYDFRRDPGNGTMTTMTRSRSHVNTFYGHLKHTWAPRPQWLFTAGLSADQHFVRSADRNVIRQDGSRAVVGYDKARIELLGDVSAKWRPADGTGVSVVLREALYGDTRTPLIPALFAEHTILPSWQLALQASVTRNHRMPTLNDLYFLPGGNPDLRPEKGFTWDAGFRFARSFDDRYRLDGSAGWFASQIDDWILWLPTAKGFFSPQNVREVHASGIESSLHGAAVLGQTQLDLSGSFSWTRSVNRSAPASAADRSVGKQLPYVPLRSASAVAQVTHQKWRMMWKWCHYSRRYTMSSNDITLTGSLPAYFMNDASLSRSITLRKADLLVRCCVYNLFDEEYVSVLAHPMPGRHFELFVSITPKFGKH